METPTPATNQRNKKKDIPHNFDTELPKGENVHEKAERGKRKSKEALRKLKRTSITWETCKTET